MESQVLETGEFPPRRHAFTRAAGPSAAGFVRSMNPPCTSPRTMESGFHLVRRNRPYQDRRDKYCFRRIVLDIGITASGRPIGWTVIGTMPASLGAPCGCSTSFHNRDYFFIYQCLTAPHSTPTDGAQHSQIHKRLEHDFHSDGAMIGRQFLLKVLVLRVIIDSDE